MMEGKIFTGGNEFQTPTSWRWAQDTLEKRGRVEVQRIENVKNIEGRNKSKREGWG